ncbi:hypothetical protein GGR42_000545 [Saonia flava]|uniref:Uncharacterized protein n=1 Tax=Saonia flava TaxID=523696 RepID=A0A846QUV9_9FLAO|nr:hypothetical protein [Saonia flava]NJB70083.1 hypothetical protein [Saonia flava]
MTCLECNKELNETDHRKSIDAFGVELCDPHRTRIEKLVQINDTPIEAIQLYYALKEVGVYTMLEWWDGKKFVDLAVSRVKLNIEVDTEYDLITHEQAMKDLEEAMHSFKNGFTTIRIPHIVIKYNLYKTVNNILGIVEGLKANIKVI